MNVIITGNSKGIGLALTIEFLKAGDDVIVSSRSEERVNQTVKSLKEQFPDRNIIGFPCDVVDEQKVNELAAFGKEKLGSLDIWINNAGYTTLSHKPIMETPGDEIKQVIDTSILGTLYGCKAALSVMIPQGNGHIFTMKGKGSDGKASPGMGSYGASKAVIPQVTKTLIQETKGTGVGIHSISPGMVLTDLLLTNTPENAKSIFNILAERPETVAKFLVPKIRAVKGTGKDFAFLTRKGAFFRFLTARRRKNRFFDDQGNFIKIKQES